MIREPGIAPHPGSRRRRSHANPRGTLRGMWAVALDMLLAGEGRPLFYWGAREAVVEAEPAEADPLRARAIQLHAALDGEDLVVRFTFDRPVADALRLPDGSPVSGRLAATLDIDVDDDRGSGLDAGADDLRTGADRRVELATRFLGGDEAERRAPAVLVTARLMAVARDSARRTLWRQDDSDDEGRLSWHGDQVELRVPAARVGLGAAARFILGDGERVRDGRLPDSGRIRE